MTIPAGVSRLDLNDAPIPLHLEDSRRVKASTIVVATRPANGASRCRSCRASRGAASGIGLRLEARLCRDEEIVLVGGGNSAGQAAEFLRNFAKKSGCWCVGRVSNKVCRAT